MVATDGEIPQSVKVLEMTGNGLQFLDAPPLMGRVFTAAEAPAGVAPPPVAVISYPFWKTHFASSPDVLGKVLELNHQKYTVIGVVGPRFTWHDSEVYVPMPAGMDPKSRFQTLIRLRPGVSTDAAAGELTSFVQQVGHAEPSLLPPDGYRIKVETLNDWILGQFKGTLILLFVAVALLLLIGCGNVSILMLARGTARLQELATRVALGASRLRIVQQLLTEAVILSVAGGVLGMAFAHVAIRLITGLIPEYSIPHEVVITLNTPVLLFSTAVSVAIGILAGLSPALQFSSPHISQMVQSAGSRSTTSHGARTRTALIVGQTALTVLMLAGAGAAMRNFLQAYAAQLGFDSHHILTLQDQPAGEILPNLAGEGELLRRAHREDQNHTRSDRRLYLRSRHSTRQQLAPACTNHRRHSRPKSQKRSQSGWLRILLRPSHPSSCKDAPSRARRSFAEHTSP